MPRENVDYRLEHFVLDPANRFVPSIDIAAAVVGDGPTLTLTMEGASTLDVPILDKDLLLVRGDFLTGWTWGENADRDEAHWIRDGRAIDAKLDDLPFRLVNIERGEDRTLTLQSEARAVAKMRRRKGALKVYRDDNFTRARFIKKLCDDAGVESHIPEIDVVQEQLEPEGSGEFDAARDGTRQARKGIPYGFEVAGTKLTRAQVSNLNTGLAECDRLRAPRKAIYAWIEAVWVEAPRATNPAGGDRDSVGILQLRSSWLGGSVERRRNVRLVTRMFLTQGFYGKRDPSAKGAIDLARKHPTWSAGEIAQETQGSAYPGRYDQTYEVANAIYKEYFGGSSEGGDSSGERTVEKPFAFSRGKNEDSWDCGNRLAEEVGWYLFERKDVIWYVSGDYLRRQRITLAIRSEDAAVDSISWSIDIGARDLVAEVTVVARAGTWTALPGMAVGLEGEGPADGRWLVHQIEGLTEKDLKTITLQKPIPAKPEPAPELTSESVRGNRRESSADAPWLKVLERAKAISRQNLPYVWGGGHARVDRPDGGTGRDRGTGYDCSGYVGACVFAAGHWPKGWGRSVPGSGTFASSWGRPGRGKHYTVWANGGHVFIEFHKSDKYNYADTSRQAGGGSGPHVRTGRRSTAGFTARHWPGS